MEYIKTLNLIHMSLKRAIKFTEENIDRIDDDHICVSRKQSIIRDEIEILREFKEMENDLSSLILLEKQINKDIEEKK